MQQNSPTIPPAPRKPGSPRSAPFALLAVGALVAGGLTALSAPAAASAETRSDKIGDHGRALLEEYEKQPWILPRSTRSDFATLIVATTEGRADAVRGELESFGADVTGVEEEIGYLKVNVGFDDVAKVEAIDDVVAIDVDELLPLPDPTPEEQGAPAAGTDGGPSAETPDDNPYMPTNETGAIDFRKDNPKADGRGVTIGVLDTGVDLEHPALQTTTTGEDKIVDWVNATDPTNLIDLIYDPMFVLTTSVTGPTFDSRGRTWTAPEGEWRFGQLDFDVAGADSGAWGVLYRPDDGTVLVDLDQNGDFTDEKPIGDFGKTGDFRKFGTDDPDTPINEAPAFVVSTLPDVYGGTVHIGLDTNGHGTHVAGIAAGHRLFDGKMNGAAPGAKVVSMRACHDRGCSSAALTDGMVALATDHGVDVINMSIGGLPALNDGQNARALLYDRLIAETGVQMFISAGNSGAGINTVGDPSVAGDVMSVGAAVSGATWRANYGRAVDYDHGIFAFSSRGPREDGGFKPDITAPGAAIAPIPTFKKGDPVADAGYELPPGYGMKNGTSMSSPQAAGGAALLLSAAKNSRQEVAPEQLRTALRSSARFSADLTAIEQGHGQIDIPAAWKLLRRGLATESLTVTAPVCTAQSDRLVKPGHGHGLYNRCLPADGGQKAGESADYELNITRDTGGDAVQQYRVRVIGDDGVFSAPRHIKLGKGEETALKVTATPQAGANSAILQLDNPRTRGVEHTVMLTVITPDVELGGGDTSWTAQGEVARAEAGSRFVAVPPGTRALTVELSGVADRSRIRWTAFSPLGPSGENVTGHCYTNLPETGNCNALTRTYNNPTPGIWDLALDAASSSPVADNPYELGVSITPAG
ncbi:subtilisin family serine protease [Nocardiopsis mwathae]|uniref:Subtilisin family serine protease n=1 Tax=Nocardiopsis mwathae TaxID=1472723 RepID=A0A7X0D5C4_9ACTN|nr:S8 family serine peptidase [Nocardiopsis mwathae]MBB6172098.1 subtilisin family serine protease [Nocardiopsis mwathae]